MSGFVYLIRNKDLYKIGITQNLEQRMKALKPDEIVSTLETDNFEKLEKELHEKYKSVRIPQTEYFRLTETQLEDCTKKLTAVISDDLPSQVESRTKEILVKGVLVLTASGTFSIINDLIFNDDAWFAVNLFIFCALVIEWITKSDENGKSSWGTLKGVFWFFGVVGLISPWLLIILPNN
tara:strand:- start:24 stop:563 length:540 start_codon:yes stop_codon:yes gene_type:complete